MHYGWPLDNGGAMEFKKEKFHPLYSLHFLDFLRMTTNKDIDKISDDY
jgi:hypothetical protein